MPGPLSVWELVIVLAVLLLLFGAKRLPEMGRSLGRGMREFKDAVTGKVDDEDERAELPPSRVGATTTTTTPPQPSETERVPR